MLTAVDLALALCLAIQFAIAGYYLYLLYWMVELSSEAPAPLSLPADLPAVLGQIPVYNEPAGGERALEAPAAPDRARGLPALPLLDDSNDLTTHIPGHAASRLPAPR